MVVQHACFESRPRFPLERRLASSLVLDDRAGSRPFNTSLALPCGKIFLRRAMVTPVLRTGIVPSVASL